MHFHYTMTHDEFGNTDLANNYYGSKEQKMIVINFHPFSTYEKYNRRYVDERFHCQRRTGTEKIKIVDLDYD